MGAFIVRYRGNGKDVSGNGIHAILFHQESIGITSQGVDCLTISICKVRDPSRMGIV